MIESARIKEAPDFVRVVVAIDPATTSGDDYGTVCAVYKLFNKFRRARCRCDNDLWVSNSKCRG